MNPGGLREENQMLLNALEMSNHRMEAINNAEILLLTTVQGMMNLLQSCKDTPEPNHAELYQVMACAVEWQN